MRGHGRKSIAPNTRGPTTRKAKSTPSKPSRSRMAKTGPKGPRMKMRGLK